MLEETLRQAFADKVELTPGGANRADKIIMRNRRSRRWRTVGTTAAAVFAFVLLIGGVTGWQLLRAPGGTDTSVFSADPTALPGPVVTAKINPHDVASLGLDLRIGDLLWTTDGRRLDLGDNGAVDRAYRVPAGWLYGSSGGVYLRPVDGRPVQVAPEGSRWSVSEDGKRIAVVTDSHLSVAELTRQGAQVSGKGVTVPAGTAPTAVLGSQVLVAGTAASGRGYEFVTVDGAGGTASPLWNPTVSGVFGIRSDVAVGLAATPDDKDLCLASLRPGDTAMSVTTTKICGFQESSEDSTHSLSPDGGWLAEPSGDELSLFSVDNALLDERSARACQATGVREPIWLDSRTVVAPYDHGVVRCQTDGARKVLEVPEAAGSSWNLVPRLGSTGG